MADRDDERLEQLVRGAFERMEPAPEAQDRMLAAILAHAEDSEDARREGFKVLETKRPRRRPWLIALPAAACLVIALVVGSGMLGGGASKGAADSSSVAAGAYDGGAPESEEAAPEAAAGTDAGGVAYSTLVTNDGAKVTTEGPAEAEADAFAEEEALAEEDAYAPFVSVVLPDGTVLVPVEGAEPLFDDDECGTQLGEFVATLPNGDEEPCEVWERAGVEGEWLVRPSSLNGMWRAVAQEG